MSVATKREPRPKARHVSPAAEAAPHRRAMTARDLLNSGLVGLWETREDLGESASFARRLRENAHRRYRK